MSASPNPATVSYIDQKAGSVNWIDKAKKYYHTIITIVGGLLAFASQISPLTNLMGADVQHYVGLGIIGLTAVANLLKSNEVWVDKL